LAANESRQLFQQHDIKEALPLLNSGGMLLFEIERRREWRVKMLFDWAKENEDIRQIVIAAGEVRVVS